MKTIIALFLCITIVGCVQKTKNRTIHFSVDMSGVADIKTVAIRGDSDPLSWYENVYLTDEDGDSIFTISLLFETPYKNIDFKFVLNDAVFEMEGKPNRRVVFEEKGDTKYDAVFGKEQ